MNGQAISFARDFATAQRRFVDAVSRAGGVLESYPHPLAGPDGESLATDIARFGAANTGKLLVLVSGVHGVEHFVGSACMIDWMEGGGPARLPDDLAVLLIHAINPWGAAHYRRYTEDNVDLARNFVDFDAPLPKHDAYEMIHEAISTPKRADLSAQLAQIFERLGERDTIEALMAGQYRHADGFSFGGNAPVWSNRLVRQLIAAHGQGASSVSIIEYHSGLGPYGYGMPVCMQDAEGYARAVHIYGDSVVAPRINEGLHSAPGHTSDGYAHALGQKQLTSIVLEFGTFPPDKSLPVLLDDHWLTQHGNPLDDDGRMIKARNLEMHCPDDPEWEKMVLARSQEIISQSIAGLEQAQ
jgi:Protein of unknown function (DUF2817)